MKVQLISKVSSAPEICVMDGKSMLQDAALDVSNQPAISTTSSFSRFSRVRLYEIDGREEGCVDYDAFGCSRIDYQGPYQPPSQYMYIYVYRQYLVPSKCQSPTSTRLGAREWVSRHFTEPTVLTYTTVVHIDEPNDSIIDLCTTVGSKPNEIFNWAICFPYCVMTISLLHTYIMSTLCT